MITALRQTSTEQTCKSELKSGQLVSQPDQEKSAGLAAGSPTQGKITAAQPQL